MAVKRLPEHQTEIRKHAGSEVLETSAPEQVAADAETYDAAVMPLLRSPGRVKDRGANLRPDVSTRHGIGPLTQRGELPAGSGDHFRDALEARRREALMWVGGVDANVFDRDEAEASARWSTASDLVWGVLFAEGLLTQTRRRKSCSAWRNRRRRSGCS